MKGVPKIINTIEDVENITEMALNSKLDKTEVKELLSSLLNDKMIYEFDREVTEDYEELPNERKRPEFDSTTSPPTLVRWVVDSLVENPNARYKLIGLTESYILAKMSTL